METKRVMIPSPGGYSKLQLKTVPLEKVGEGQVLVKNWSFGVNFADCVIRLGLYESAKKYVGYPISPGFEFVGEVLESKDPTFKEGDLVCGVSRFFAYGEHVVVPADQLFAVPKGLEQERILSFGGFPVTFLTAYHALKQIVVIRPQSTILVHSSSGGVGSSLVQIAKLLGHTVVGVVGRAHKQKLSYELGAQKVYVRDEDLFKKLQTDYPEGFDAIFDANGAQSINESYRLLAPTGKLVIYGFHTMFSKSPWRGLLNPFGLLWAYMKTPRFNPLHLSEHNKTIAAFNLSMLFDKKALLKEAMDELLPWFVSGQLRMPEVVFYPLDKIAQAHAHLESGESQGKIIIRLKSP